MQPTRKPGNLCANLMKRIEVRLSLPAVAPLLDIAKLTADTLHDSLAAPAGLEQLDPELRADWKDERQQAQAGDLQALLALFDREFFSTGVVAFDEANAEGVLRATAAVRLRLREKFLSEVPDEQLESGEVDPTALPEPARRAFLCYVFFGDLQQLIIQHLASVILGGE